MKREMFEKELRKELHTESYAKDRELRSEEDSKLLHEENKREFANKIQLELSRKESKKRIGYGTFLFRQIKYLSWKIWMFQGGILLGLLLILGCLYEDQSLLVSRRMIVLLSGSAVLIVLTAIPILRRSMTYQMLEIEAAARCSIGRLLVAKLLLLTIGDIVMVFGVLLLTLHFSTMGMWEILLFILAPMLLMSSGILYGMCHISINRISSFSLVWGVMIVLATIVMTRYLPTFFERNYIILRMGVTVVLLIICLCQILRIQQRLETIELQMA